MRFLMLTALAAALPVAAASAQSPNPLPLLEGTTLDVVAQGATTRVPDLATIRTGVVTQAPTAVAALAENAGRMARVLAALKRAGVAARDVTTTAATLNPQYRYADNQPPVIIGYQATNTVSVRFRDVATTGAILDALVAQGANQIEGPTLSLAQPDAAFDEARADAVKRARARAELYARAAGLSVARIISISEGGETPTDPGPVRYALAKAAADTTILPGESQVSVTVAVRFLLK